MTIRQLLVVAAAAAALTALAIVTVDAPVARALAEVDPASAPVRALDAGLAALDEVTGMSLPRGVLPGALVALGAALWWWRRDAGRVFLILGVTHAVSRLGGGYLKPVFGRLRPSEALAAGDLDHTFFRDGGIAFPSGHVGHYAALALAVALLAPRARLPALAVLAFVIAARLARDAHFVSDVTGAIALAALGAAAAGALFPQRRATNT